MDVTDNTLKTLESEDGYCDVVSDYVVCVLGEARLFPRISRPRLIEAHGAWRNDLSRVSDNEPHLAEGLDHFKQCGHLAF